MKVGIAGLATIVAMAVLAPTASAATKTTIFDFAVSNYAGAGEPYEAGVLLKSKKKKCIRDRKVTFFKKGDRLGSRRTDKDGLARLSLGESDRSKVLGKYSAKVKKGDGCSGAEAEGRLTPTIFHRDD